MEVVVKLGMVPSFHAVEFRRIASRPLVRLRGRELLSDPIATETPTAFPLQQ